MPLVGEYHRQFWRARANPVAAPVPGKGGYPAWQASVCSMMAILPPFDALQPLWITWCWLWRVVRSLWRCPVELRDDVDQWIGWVLYTERDRRNRTAEWDVRLASCTTPQLTVLTKAVETVSSPDFHVALEAVRQTATTLGFNHPAAWKPYSHMLKESPGRAENVFRHERACTLTRAAVTRTLTNPEVNFLVELAYHGWTVSPKVRA